MDAAFVHVALFSFHKTTMEANRAEALQLLQTLGTVCGGEESGVLFWKVEQNLDQRKSWHLFELAIFRDRGAFETFRAHPAHADAANRMRKIADWAVADMMTALPLITVVSMPQLDNPK